MTNVIICYILFEEKFVSDLLIIIWKYGVPGLFSNLPQSEKMCKKNNFLNNRKCKFESHNMSFLGMIIDHRLF